MNVDVARLKEIAAANNRYDVQLSRLTEAGKQTSCIKDAVEKSIENIQKGHERSFVIYGEPQSGKTEMMICLTARLIDAGFSIVVHLLNDSVQLLQQNLERFQRSRLAPAAKNFSDVLDPDISLRTGHHVIFCKKNTHDLNRLIEKIGTAASKVIIDDEADFATPNAKINQGEVTKINQLVGDLLGTSGIYIGVTATPARLDLNNTFNNNNEVWVNFPPHEEYTGQDVFFPVDSWPNGYNLKLLPDQDDGPRFLREAVHRFLVRVAFMNLSAQKEQNFSMLIHTSGKKIDHKADKKPIDDVFQALVDTSSAKFVKAVTEIKSAADSLYEPGMSDRILDYVVANKDRFNTIILNSERDKNTDFKSATNPSALFTFVIGGNIVSRGVTFDNLLSMFFTRDSKHKLQQDTYIQRARMFGSRKAYLQHFELTIPNQLFAEWHKCFVFHKLALAAIKAGLGSPVWLGDMRISPVSAASIDQANVSLDRGEMSFRLFDYDERLVNVIRAPDAPPKKLKKIQDLIGDKALPDYVIRYVESTSAQVNSIAIHEPVSIENYRDADGLDKDKIERKRGFFGKSQRDKFPDAVHHFAVFRNGKGKARVIYKFVGNITFIKNLKHVG
ncbi:MAG TPA: Z1 domain-containing protein [Xanthobacteraceae bacterium]|nr:Z1 domain-containing protein [Xanthobacteraceae bacterium]